ncbi:MAG: PocR ligand-binding domain-containing protein [Clostridia bacterium]|nr:PocR ligand-binding domain-containing protein [Clostridia bacterium]
MNIRFDTDKLRELLRDFHTLTGMRLVIFDDSFNKLCAWPDEDCEFCTRIKQDSRARRLCGNCDEEACRLCCQTDRLYIYSCHAGLTEAVLPLKMDGINLGYIMLGQNISQESKAEHFDQLVDYAEKFIPDDASRLIEGLSTRSDEEIRAAAKLMETCACYLWVRELISVDDGSIVIRLSRYIDDNLSADLSADALCDQFGISRNRLYRIAGDYFGCGIAAYIRRKRVEKATSLLREGATVAEAAEAVGLYDYNYFSKIYKRETGMLPSRVRRR